MSQDEQTRFILVGGGWKYGNQKAAFWQARMLEQHPGQVKVLICLFSRSPDQWLEQFGRCERLFRENLGSVADYELAQPGAFLEQIQRATIIYLDEGDNVLAEQNLTKYPHLQKRFLGKTIVGSSAGANVLSAAYYSRSLRSVRSGLGILPVKVITHFETQPMPEKPLDWRRITEELVAYKDPQLPVYTLKENEFVTLDDCGDIL